MRIGKWEVSEAGGPPLINLLVSELETLEPSLSQERRSKIAARMLEKILDEDARQFLRWVLNTMIDTETYGNVKHDHKPDQ